MREIVVLAGAEADLLSVYCWYEALDPDLADRFDAAVHTELELLLNQPWIGGRFRGPYRRLSVRGFSCYSIFYVIEDSGRISIAAVLDLRQSPHAILRRLGVE
jgi:plasmid stabilization system protein ParE